MAFPQEVVHALGIFNQATTAAPTIVGRADGLSLGGRSAAGVYTFSVDQPIAAAAALPFFVQLGGNTLSVFVGQLTVATQLLTLTSILVSTSALVAAADIGTPFGIVVLRLGLSR